MTKELENDIMDRIQRILCTTATAAELAASFLDHRRSAGLSPGDREEIREQLSGVDAVRENPRLLEGIGEAYFHFSAQILYEDGFFSNSQIHDRLVSADQIGGRIDESMAAYELVSNAPVSVNPRSVLAARDNLAYLTGEPFPLKSSQLTALQMLCLDDPEAITDVLRVMGERPFVRAADDDDRPYLRAFVKVLRTLVEHDQPGSRDRDRNAVTGAETRALIAGIVSAFYHEYLTLPSEDYLLDLIDRSL